MLYALGGGMGHLTRATSLARAAARSLIPESERTSGVQISLLTNSPFASQLPLATELGTGSQIVTLDPHPGRDETARSVTSILQNSSMDVLVVDTFPRGLGGELSDILPKLNCHKVLIHRDLNPRYCARVDIAGFVRQFDCILVPGESAPFDTFPQAIQTVPWLIRDAHELMSPAAALRMLEVETQNLPVVAVIGCGKSSEVQEMRSIAAQLTKDFRLQACVRFVTPHQSESAAVSIRSQSEVHTVQLWPFLQAIRGVAMIVGSGGYNTVNEARATQTAFLGLSQPRLYDRQDRRLRAHERVSGYQELRQRVAVVLESCSMQPIGSAPRYENGVHKAIEIIESLCG
jgi:predicted glycosyltransferase